jgi:hypothetical protein
MLIILYRNYDHMKKNTKKSEEELYQDTSLINDKYPCQAHPHQTNAP